MAGSIKQQQVANLLRGALDHAFRKTGFYNQSPGMVSIHEVVLSPDLMDAKVYINLFQIADEEKFWENLNQKQGEIKKIAGTQLRHKLRRIPNIRYIEDKTIDNAFRIEKLLDEIDIPDEDNPKQNDKK